MLRALRAREIGRRAPAPARVLRDRDARMRAATHALCHALARALPDAGVLRDVEGDEFFVISKANRPRVVLDVLRVPHTHTWRITVNGVVFHRDIDEPVVAYLIDLFTSPPFDFFGCSA